MSAPRGRRHDIFNASLIMDSARVRQQAEHGCNHFEWWRRHPREWNAATFSVTNIDP
jgi:hypothetical protein